MLPVNKRENQNPIVQKIDTMVMSESEKLLLDLDSEVSDLAGIIDILRDRIIQSTDLSHVIGLAKLGELKIQALKQKNDVLKNLTSYKTTEAAIKKGSGELNISDLLNSAALGAGMGAKLNMSGQTKIIDSTGQQLNFVDAEIEITPTQLETDTDICDTFMKDFK